MSERIKIFLAMITAMFFWGISFIWSEQALVIYNPVSVVMFRLIISVILLYIINFWFRRINRLLSKDIFLFILLSFLQPFIYFVGENYGIVYTDATTTSIIISTIPLFGPIAAYFLLKEKISLINFIGIIISICGVILVILKDNFSISASPIGLMFLFGAVVAAVLYSVLVLNLAGRYNIYTITVYQNLIGLLWFVPAFLLFDFTNFVKTGFELKAFIPIILLAIFGSTLCFLLFIYGVKKLGITKANIFGNTIPVFTAFFAFLILDAKFSLLNIFGIVLVLLGVLITQIDRKKLRKVGTAVKTKFKLSKIHPKS